MLKQDLIKLIKDIQKNKYEGQHLELKSANKGFPRIYETLSAFSNQDNGGTIIFGISEKDNYSIVGVYNPQDLIHMINEQCKQMEPVLQIQTTEVEIDSKVVVCAEIPPRHAYERPVYYKGAGIIKGSYIRVGNSNEQMNDIDVYNYQVYKMHIQNDSRLAPIESANYMDESLIKSYLNKTRLARPKTQDISDKDLKDKLGLIKNNNPTLASVMCFSKLPQFFYPQLCVTAVCISGYQLGDLSSNGERFIDNKKIEGTIPEMIDQVVSFVSRNMKTAIKFDKAKRIDIDQYPLEAVKEAIQNALVHRDYSIRTEGMPVRLEMYKDRLEICNPGGLFGPLNVDQLGSIRAEIRNKTLVSILETMSVIENRYSGIPTIIKEMKKVGLPPPLFINSNGMFKVVLFNSNSCNSLSNDKNKKIVDFCSSPKSRKELSQFLDMSQYYAMKNIIEPLVEAGQLFYTNPDKPKSKNQKFCSKW